MATNTYTRIHTYTHSLAQCIKKDPAGSTQQQLIRSYKKRNETSLFRTENEAPVMHKVLSGIRETEMKREREKERERL